MNNDIINTIEGRNKAIEQMKNHIEELQSEITNMKKTPEHKNYHRVIIGNGAIINSLEIGIRSLEKLNKVMYFHGSLKELNKKPFETTQSNLLKYNGQDFEILRELTEQEADIQELGKMYRIRFNDGFETDRFEDEIIR